MRMKDNTPKINVGDLVLWTATEPTVLGIVIEIINVGFFGYDGIRVLWFGHRGQNAISPCRMVDVKVLSSAKPEKS